MFEKLNQQCSCPRPNLLQAVDNSSFAQVIGRHLNCHLISYEYTNISHSHLPAKLRHYSHSILQRNPKHHIWKQLLNLSLELECVFFCHL